MAALIGAAMMLGAIAPGIGIIAGHPIAQIMEDVLGPVDQAGIAACAMAIPQNDIGIKAMLIALARPQGF